MCITEQDENPVFKFLDEYLGPRYVSYPSSTDILGGTVKDYFGRLKHKGNRVTCVVDDNRNMVQLFVHAPKTLLEVYECKFKYNCKIKIDESLKGAELMGDKRFYFTQTLREAGIVPYRKR